MKVFAFLFLAISLVVEITSSDSEEDAKEEILTKWMETCATELEVPQAKLDEYEAMIDFSNDTVMHCLTACIFEKIEAMKDGKIIDDVTSVLFDEFEDQEEMEKMTEIVETCQKKANIETDKCETAGVFAICLHDEMEE